MLVAGPLFNWLSTDLNKTTALGWTLAISGLTCVVSVVCSIVSNFHSLLGQLCTLGLLDLFINYDVLFFRFWQSWTDAGKDIRNTH